MLICNQCYRFALAHERLDTSVWTRASGHERLDTSVWTRASGHERLEYLNIVASLYRVGRTSHIHV